MFGPSEGIGTFSKSVVGGNGGIVVGRRAKAGVGSVAAAVDHVFVRAKEKSKTVSGGEGRGRLGPKEEVEDVGEKGNGWRTRAPGGKVGSAERRVGGGQPWTGKGHPAAKLGERRKKERTGRRAVGVLI